MMYRTHTCGELRPQHQHLNVKLAGWIQTIRSMGTISFLDLRDHYGITQLVVSELLLKNLPPLGREFVIQIEGKVIERKNKNPHIPTGEIEVEVEKINIINASKTPPFTIIDETDGGDDLRMKFRYLDLRRPQLQKNLKLRNQVTQCIRTFLSSQHFNEIETPFLIKSTPEGARDFIVPSRINPNQFYALPQSPQTFKQLLMIAGYDRYFQIVRCFRDEDLRADRQPEFTQLDCEMTFVNQQDVMRMFEHMIKFILRELKGVDIKNEIPILTYDEAMRDYGSDKPDLRFDMKIQNFKVKGQFYLSSLSQITFETFQQAESILALVITQGSHFSRKDIDQLSDFIKRPQIGMKGLAYIKYDETGVSSSLEKYCSSSMFTDIKNACSANSGDMVLILAGKESLVRKATGELRLFIAQKLNLLNPDDFSLLWVKDFPLFFTNEETGELEPCHHPFTSPRKEDEQKLFDDHQISDIKAQAYDMVLNGAEIGGGSIRIHHRPTQERIFQLLQLSPEQIHSKFGFILEAFEYGAPPHGGIAFGLDRICALLAGTTSIRDVIAFPKNNNGRDMMLDAPSLLDEPQLKELHIQLKK